MIILKTILLFFLIAFLIYDVIYLIWDKFPHYTNYPKIHMKYKNWKDIYNLNPERWKLKEYLETFPRIYYYQDGISRKYRISFNIVDFLKFIKFYFIDLKYNKSSEKAREGLKEILTNAQKDIDKKIKKYSNETNKVNDFMKNIVNENERNNKNGKYKSD